MRGKVTKSKKFKPVYLKKKFPALKGSQSLGTHYIQLEV